MDRPRHIPNVLRKKCKQGKRLNTDKMSQHTNYKEDAESQCNSDSTKTPENILLTDKIEHSNRNLATQIMANSKYLCGDQINLGSDHQPTSAECQNQTFDNLPEYVKRLRHSIIEEYKTIENENQEQNISESEDIISVDKNVAHSFKIEPSDDDETSNIQTTETVVEYGDKLIKQENKEVSEMEIELNEHYHLHEEIQIKEETVEFVDEFREDIDASEEEIEQQRVLKEELQMGEETVADIIRKQDDTNVNEVEIEALNKNFKCNYDNTCGNGFLQITMSNIRKKPFFYIRVPKIYYFLINIIEQQTSIPEHHIVLCLKKIRLGNRFFELADDFGISVVNTSQIFFDNVPLLASVLRPFVRKVSNVLIKKYLPVQFKSKYEDVTCVINCLEIDIQRRYKSKLSDSTCSKCGKSFKIKYLISSTPDGLVNYISTGFTGISDIGLLKRSNFINTIESGTIVMAGKRFKHVEGFLHKAGVKLVRPNYVDVDMEVNGDIEFDKRHNLGICTQVIRKLRQFHMLKQHSVISPKMLTVLDDIVTIACGLINLQKSK